MDSLRQIAEDTLLLAARIREGESLDEESMVLHDGDDQEHAAMREWRILELVVNVAERLAETAGIDLAEEAWVPDGVRDLL